MSKDSAYCEQTKPKMETLAKSMHVTLQRDECGDYVVQGRRGNIHADGAGYLVSVMCPTAEGWNIAKREFGAFCRVTQDGDTEGVLHMPALPTPEQAALLRLRLEIHKIKELSAETIEAIKARTAAYRFNPRSTAPAPIVAE